MSAKAIREYHGKKMLGAWLSKAADDGLNTLEQRCVQITDACKHQADYWNELASNNPWLRQTRLVVKPDQLIKRRGKAGLVAIDKSYAEAQNWVLARMGVETRVEHVSGMLDTFIIEPYVAHPKASEYYICLQSHRGEDEFLFHHQGGVDVGDVDAKAVRMSVPIGVEATADGISDGLLVNVPAGRRPQLAHFLLALFRVFRELHYVYLEINPLVVMHDTIAVLDLAAKVDETAHFLVGPKWGDIDFPAPFGRAAFPEEAYIADLDSKTGASLKLTILNHAGRIWTMVAGGGASVVYADTIADLGFGAELANYGEYSGAPNEQQTFNYAKTILGLMTRVKDPRGKVLIIGGGIANFTDVAGTFKGIIAALRAYQDELREGKVSIWVRRGGPNYQEGLRQMREVGNEINVPLHVYGPETHIVAPVPVALGVRDLASLPEFDEEDGEPQRKKPKVGMKRNHSSFNTTPEDEPELPPPAAGADASDVEQHNGMVAAADAAADATAAAGHNVITSSSSTRCFVYGLQNRAVQGMLDFDFMCKRDQPSVAAMIYPFTGNHYIKFYWGTSEVLVPCYSSMAEAVEKHPEVSVFVNFASFRSVHQSVCEALEYSTQIKTIAIIAEGVPEGQTRDLIRRADEKKVGIIGPATVGGIKPGCFRIGNTGGMLDNIVMSKLYRPGSVAYVSKSGGMSNELNNLICRNSDGVCEGVAIGGDRYPGSRFMDHLLRYQDNPEVKMMVLLGEVGGTDEYEVCDAVRTGRISKPIVAWCIGTCASIFPYEVQFGHAGACARGNSETAAAKNAALRAAGVHVPETFAYIGEKIKEVYGQLRSEGRIVPREEPPVPMVPMDYNWAKRLGLVRKPANFVSSISDDRGEELKYAGMPISEVFSENLGVGGVLSLLWFRRRLPAYATKFIEMILMVTADHGPAVAGAHNTIVAARAGKDLISSLVSGLLTIGPRFGGALDAAAQIFTKASDEGVNAAHFVSDMKKKGQLIMGIGHKIKSLDNPDKRVEIIKNYALEHFESNGILNFALEVEQVTTRKKSNLILNVDGCIAVCFVDMLRSSGAFTPAEVTELIELGCLNGLFVLGRSMGFMGHYLDQNRLKQGLYRHPVDDISYIGGM
mmetsp:Transcript_13222/g.39330  ORF Transcript_13222/g.39330 Transcript_13222/m.39330 type:complete len:1116 (-) Transcript_13222:129-3476(-)